MFTVPSAARALLPGRISPAALFTLLLCLTVYTPANAAPAAEKAPAPKTALVLATFGTTQAQKDDPLALVQAEIHKRRPDLALFTAYTSAHVMRTLQVQGKEARTPAQVLADLSARGYTHVAVQSLHVTPGLEYELLCETVSRFSHLPKGITATASGRPLIGGHSDAASLAGILAAALPKERKKEDAVVFVGHGAAGDSGSLAYPALQNFLRDIDPNFFIGTIEGPFAVEAVVQTVKAHKAKKVWLVPLLTVVGEHALNDIFGDEKDSWKQSFIAAGITTVPVHQGLGSLQGTASLWADHAEAALKSLEQERPAQK